MANDLNRCEFIGRLGKDPEINHFANGDMVANFSIAVGWKGKDKEGCEWVNIVAHRKLAEIIGRYCTKGQQIFVAGKLQTRKWQDRNGADRYTTEVVAHDIQMLGGRDSQGSTGGAPRTERPAQGQHGGGNGNYGGGGEPPFNPDDDIPFRCLPHWRESF